GVILYLTFWLSPSVRYSVMALFVTAIPLSNIIGSPISAQILQLDHLVGLRGWQWLFILEGSPAILLGFCVLFLFPDRPGSVSWLTAEEKQTLSRDLSAAAPPHSAKAHSLFDAFTAQPIVYGWSI